MKNDDLISRQAAIDALDRIGSLDTEADKKYARSVFEALPSAQPKRKKGKWIVEGHHPNYLLRCSACQEIAMWAGGISYIYPNFCPNCGADMREEKNDVGSKM